MICNIAMSVPLFCWLLYQLMAVRLLQESEGRSASLCNLLCNRFVKQDAALKHVYELPADTFGGAYAQFMRKRQFHADDRCGCWCMFGDERYCS